MFNQSQLFFSIYFFLSFKTNIYIYFYLDLFHSFYTGLCVVCFRKSFAWSVKEVDREECECSCATSGADQDSILRLLLSSHAIDPHSEISGDIR